LKRTFLVLIFLVGSFTAFSQKRAITFQEAEKQGIPFQKLDLVYKSAVHSDTLMAVFKTPEEQVKLQKAYAQYLQSLGSFLKASKFSWEKETRCFNRIYFNKDGTVDQFLYNFPPGQVDAEKEEEFKRLLSLFINDFKFPLTANENFAQCSPVRYSDQ
jgi:hypothetical protein